MNNSKNCKKEGRRGARQTLRTVWFRGHGRPSALHVENVAHQLLANQAWTVLQKQGAITNEDVRECKQRMNTFAYIGSIRDNPVVRCVYQADINENKFITKGVSEDAIGVNQEAIQF